MAACSPLMGRFIELRQRASAASARDGPYYIRPNPVMATLSSLMAADGMLIASLIRLHPPKSG
jgi:hypothetical protein